MYNQYDLDLDQVLLQYFHSQLFDPHNIEYNIIALTQISAILDSLPTRLSRSEMEQKIFKMASSKIKTGIEICKSIDPDNRVVKHFESKY